MLESLLIAYVESLPLFATASACTSTGSDDEIRVVTVHTPFYQAAEISWCGMPGTRLVLGGRRELVVFVYANVMAQYTYCTGGKKDYCPCPIFMGKEEQQ